MDPFKNALKFLQSIEAYLPESQQPYLERLKVPQNLVKGEIEVIMDDGKRKSFSAFRSQHNNALGPYKGGIRFHPQVTESEVKALSLWMSLKTSIAGLPLGGGKGGVIVDPHELSAGELERLARAYAAFIAPHIGVDKDIPAPDVNTNPQIMAWMLDEYEKIVDHHVPGVITGKPLELGGSLGRTKATGYGGVLAMQFLLNAVKDGMETHSGYDDGAGGQVAKDKSNTTSQSVSADRKLGVKMSGMELFNKPKSQITIAVQGFGNVGYYFAKIASDLGFRVVAVSDSKGGVYVEEGLDPVATLACKEEKGRVANCYCVGGVCDLKGGKEITNEELLCLDVDILVPSAMENVIHKENANSIRAKIVVEMANGPITSEADDILNERGVLVIPDIFANAGGVTVSYLEWIQNRTGHYWTEEEVDENLELYMSKAFMYMWKKYLEIGRIESSKSKGRSEGKKTRSVVSLRKAAYILAVERILAAEMLRRP